MAGISNAIEVGEGAARLYDFIMGRQTGGRIFGRGDYTVNKNSIMSDSAIPTFSGGKNYVDLVHRECIVGSVQSSTAFTVQHAINLNPGLLAPWIARYSTLFEEYEAMGVVFQFRSTSADALNSTNTALGTVVMMTDYDAYDAPPTSKIRMEASEFATSTKPSLDVLHPVECKPKLNPLARQYVRSGPVSTGDLRMYDQGTFYLATEGMQAAATIGELWVTYHYRFFKPTLPDTEYVLAADHWYSFGTIGSGSKALYEDANTLQPGSTGFSTISNGLGANTIRFDEVGDYTVTINAVYAGSVPIVTLGSPVLANLIGCTLLATHPAVDPNYTSTDVAGAFCVGSVSTKAVGMLSFTVSVNTAGATVHVEAGSINGSCNLTVDTTIVRQPPNLTFNEDPRERRLRELEETVKAMSLEFKDDFDIRSLPSSLPGRPQRH
jgi:hypothetical protein